MYVTVSFVAVVGLVVILVVVVIDVFVADVAVVVLVAVAVKSKTYKYANPFGARRHDYPFLCTQFAWYACAWVKFIRCARPFELFPFGRLPDRQMNLLTDRLTD